MLVYGKAPYLSKYADFFEQTYQQEWKTLTELNVYMLRWFLDTLGINVKIRSAGEWDFQGVTLRAANFFPMFQKHAQTACGGFQIHVTNPKQFASWRFGLFMLKTFYKQTEFKFKWNDPLCGMKGYTMELYRNRGWFDSLHSIGTELAMFGILNNYKVSQINIPISTRNDNPRFASTLKANIVIFKALFNLIFMKKII